MKKIIIIISILVLFVLVIACAPGQSSFAGQATKIEWLGKPSCSDSDSKALDERYQNGKVTFTELIKVKSGKNLLEKLQKTTLQDSCKDTKILLEYSCKSYPQNPANKDIYAIGTKLGSYVICSNGCDGKKGACSTPPPPKPSCDDLIKNGDEENIDCGGSCKACPVVQKLPDLVVKSIAKTALSEQCINSFWFTICNNGEGDVKDTFTLSVTSNVIQREYLVDQSTVNQLTADSCVDIKAPEIFNVGGFGYGLNSNADVTVTLDTTNKILEKNENNNEAKETVFTGDAYYYDTKTTCDTFCYESDVGLSTSDPKGYNTKGTVTWKYNGKINDKNDFCVSDLIGISLGEKKCNIVSLNKEGLFSNPYSSELYNCLDQDPPRKCVNGQCIPLSTLCKNSNGKSVPCVTCTDTEVASIPFVINNDVYYNLDPFAKGKVDYTTVDNEKKIAEDMCGTNNNLFDVTCVLDQNNLYSIPKTIGLSCSSYTTPSGNSYICKEGACVPPPDDTIDTIIKVCIGPPLQELDFFLKKSVIVSSESKSGKTESKYSDYCLSEDSVTKQYCNGNEVESKDFNCKILKGSDGIGAACVDGKCVYFNADLQKCEESDDNGYDVASKGKITYTTGYGVSGEKADTCSDNNVLIETYCNGNNNIIDNYDCKKDGKKCQDGKCV